MGPLVKMSIGALIGIAVAAAAFFFFFSEKEPAPYPETVANSRDLLPGLEASGRARMTVSQEISGQGIPGSDGLASFLRRGLSITSEGDFGRDASVARVALRAGDGQANVSIAKGKKESFIGIGGRWFLQQENNPLLGIVPGASPQAALRLWRALPKKARVLASVEKDGLSVYTLDLKTKRLREMAAAWSGSGNSALASLADNVTTMEVAFSTSDGSLRSLETEALISSNRLARLLGLASSRPLGGLRQVRVSFSLQIDDWSPGREILMPQVYGQSQDGQSLLAQQLLPFWAGIGDD